MNITSKDVVKAYLAARHSSKSGRYVSPYRMLRITTKQPRETIYAAIAVAFNQGYIKTVVSDILKGYATEKGKELVK